MEKSDSHEPSFRGNFAHTIDEKGRVSLPADFRKILLDRSVVLTNYISEGSRCLDGFGLSAWQSFEHNLRQKSRFSSQLQKFENFYLSRAAECQIDSQGRILVPTHLRNYASLEKEVTFTSSINGFRVWDSRVWSYIFNATESELLADPELFANLDI
jgi:MraZ protein